MVDILKHGYNVNRNDYVKAYMFLLFIEALVYNIEASGGM
jgi:hypothetical protein